jgi:hypothetical protein
MSNDILVLVGFTIWSAVIIGVGLMVIQDTDFEKELQKQIDEKKAKTL